MTFIRGDVAWMYSLATGEVRPVIVLGITEQEVTLIGPFIEYRVLFGTIEMYRSSLYDTAEEAQETIDRLYLEFPP